MPNISRNGVTGASRGWPSAYHAATARPIATSQSIQAPRIDRHAMTLLLFQAPRHKATLEVGLPLLTAPESSAWPWLRWPPAWPIPSRRSGGRPWRFRCRAWRPRSGGRRRRFRGFRCRAGFRPGSRRPGGRPPCGLLFRLERIAVVAFGPAQPLFGSKPCLATTKRYSMSPSTHAAKASDL